MAAGSALASCAQLVAGLPNGVFARPSTLLPGGTVGRHVRHLVDHLHEAARARGRTGEVIDYDHRQRETAVETEILVALGVIERVRTLLAAVTEPDAAMPVRVRSMLASDGTGVVRESTLGREIAFAHHHALHHLAMIAAICREHGVHVDPETGKAPATVAYEKTRAVGGQPRP